MKGKPSNGAIAAGLFLAVLLWGANNTGTKYLIGFWPPIFVGFARFAVAGAILLALLHQTKIFGDTHPVSSALNRRLWWHGGLTLAAYTVVMNWALVSTPISHVAVYLGAAPVWALLWEGWPERNWKSFQRYLAAGCAVTGVFILFFPALRGSSAQVFGEILGLISSVLWTNYGRQCRGFGQELTGAEVSAHTFWRCAVFLLPLALWEIVKSPLVVSGKLVGIQLFCATGGAVVAYALWNTGLRHWKTSQVYLFNNLIPLSTLCWAHATLGEPITPTFWMATTLIVAGVLIGQANWQKIFGKSWIPFE